MIAWLRRAIAWLAARDDLQELERWRVEAQQVRRWMAEFPDVCTALDHLECFAYGHPYRGLTEVREGMRNRRNAGLGPFTAAALTAPRTMTPAELDEFAQKWRAIPAGLRVAPLAELECATDWDVAARS